MKGVMACTDDEIRADLKAGKFLRQIMRERKAGLKRVRRIDREGNNAVS